MMEVFWLSVEDMASVGRGAYKKEIVIAVGVFWDLELY